MEPSSLDALERRGAEQTPPVMSSLSETKSMSDDEAKALKLKEEGNEALGLSKFIEVSVAFIASSGPGA